MLKHFSLFMSLCTLQICIFRKYFIRNRTGRYTEYIDVSVGEGVSVFVAGVTLYDRGSGIGLHGAVPTIQ